MVQKKKKVLIFSSVAMVLISIIGFMLYQSNKALPVTTIQLEKIKYEAYHYEEGTVKSKEQMKVFSPGSGKIIDLFVKEGATLNKNDLILTIEKDDLNNQLELLNAEKNSLIGDLKAQVNLKEEELEMAKNKVSPFELDLQRKTQLYDSGAISKKDFEDFQFQYKQSLNELNVAKKQLAAARERLNLENNKISMQIQQKNEKLKNMQLSAPIGGILSDFSLKKGDYVSENQGLFEIFHPHLYEIETYVLAKQVKNLKVGMDAYIEIENQSKTETIKGKISYIGSNAIEIVSPLGLVENKVKVLVEPAEEVNFIQGEKVDVKFITYRKDNAQVVSKDYIFPWMDGEGMWIIENDKAKVVKINKVFDASAVVVLEKVLAEGTKIIIPPYPEKIVEGIPVISKKK